MNPIVAELEKLVSLYVPDAKVEGKTALVQSLGDVLSKADEIAVTDYVKRREAGEIRYHDRHCGMITRREETQFMHVVREEYPCGCPKAGLVVRNWWDNWAWQDYMDATWDYKYLSPRWMENLAENYKHLVGGKSFGELLCPFGPPCRDPLCLSPACLNRKARKMQSPETVGPYENKPCYIIGSGPSLKKNAHELRNVRHGLKIAINGAVPLVDDFDIFLTMDWKGAPWWSAGHEEKLKRATGLIGWSSHPDIFKLEFKERILFAQCGKCAWDNWIREVFPWMLDLDRGFSSTFCAMHFAVQAGCNPIVFVGCDGAFGPDMGMHAAHDDKPKPTELEIIDHLDIYGQTVKTCITYYLQNQCLKGASAWATMHGLRIVNATEGGILWMRTKEGKDIIEQGVLSDVIASNNLLGDVPHEAAGVQAECEVQESVR